MTLIKERNQVSSRAPEWVEPITKEAIKNNNRLIEELINKGHLIPEN